MFFKYKIMVKGKFMPNCYKCGAKITENDSFCEACGAKQEQTPYQATPAAAKNEPPVQVYMPKSGNTRKSNGLLFAIIAILAAGLIAFGVLYFIENSNLKEAKVNISNLEGDVAVLQTDLAKEQANVTSLQTQLANEKANVARLENELAEEQANAANLQTQLNASKAEVTQLESDLAASELQIYNLQSELAEANANVASLESELANALSQIDSLQGQLTALQAKYPLKDFPNYKTLQAWVKENVQTDTTIYADEYYSMALKMQLLAAEDGYFVSACLVSNTITDDGYYYVYNTALVGDILYYFSPDDTEIYSWGEWGR
jgi:hypothetical protein